MVQPDAVRNPGALSRDAEQPPQIRPGSHPDRLAGKQYPDGDRRRRFRRRIRLHFNFIQRLFLHGSRSDQADLLPWRRPPGRSDEGPASRLRPPDPKQYEGQYRPLPGGRHHRRISIGKGRTGLSDHLREPGFEAGAYSDTIPYPILFLVSYRFNIALCRSKIRFSSIKLGYMQSKEKYPLISSVFYTYITIKINPLLNFLSFMLNMQINKIII